VSRAVAVCALLSFGAFGCSLASRFPGGGARPAEAAGGTSRRAGTPAGAGPAAPRVLETTAIDRVVVRWHAPETGGIAKPQFVFARELAFQARLEALADPDPDRPIYRDRHVRAALDRHIAETLLSSLRIVPEPTDKELDLRAQRARAVLEARVGSPADVIAAREAEGVSEEELRGMLLRQARASLYLDRMVAPMLEPTNQELRALQETGQTQFSAQDLASDAGRERMRRWYVGARLAQALDTYYQNARSRVSIVTVKRP
jgi:hypothetical protein